MKHFKFINKLIVLTVITSSIFTTIAKADEVSNNDNATFLNAVYEKENMHRTQTTHYMPLLMLVTSLYCVQIQMLKQTK